MSRPNQLIQDGALLDGQFLLIRQLGAGGMGTVWAAEDMRLGRTVAIKFVSQDYHHDQQARLRFDREAKMVSRIRSPHVVQVYAQGVTPEGVQYIVMEMLEGEDLASRIASTGPVSLVEAGSLLTQICRALRRAHAEGLVHRDIKPHNIFLTPEPDGQAFVRLLDFGIAKESSGRNSLTLTLTGEVIGSALYVSPEQLNDSHAVGPASDLWSLGVVIYEMLTGRMPFDGNSLPELFFLTSQGKFTPASEVNPNLPKELDALLLRLIQPDLQLRMRSVEELSVAFTKLVGAHSSGLMVKNVPGVYSDPPPPIAAPVPAEAGNLSDSTRVPRHRSGLVVAGLLLLTALALAVTYLMRADDAALAAPAPAAPIGTEPFLVRPLAPSAPPAAAPTNVPEPLPIGTLPAVEPKPDHGKLAPPPPVVPQPSAAKPSPTPSAQEPAIEPARPASSEPSPKNKPRNYGF